MKRVLFVALVAWLAAGAGAQNANAQKKDSVALLPFTGAQGGDGAYIAGELARQRIFQDTFNRVTLVTETTPTTDVDTLFGMGRQLNAAYVIAGHITKLGNQSMVLVSLLSVESLQQVGGDYRTYGNTRERNAMIADMAKKLAQSAQRDTASLPGLSVPSFELPPEINADDALLLARLLMIDLAKGNTFALLPRTGSLEEALEEGEEKSQREEERVNRLGAGRPSHYALALSVGKLGTLTKFSADILDKEDGSFVGGYSEAYNTLAEGATRMPILAASLNGVTVVRSAGQNLGALQNTATMPANFIRIAGGLFMMGSPESEAERYHSEVQHQVTVSKAFYIGKFEVTQKEWVEVMGTNPSYFKGDSLPVENVSWYDAVEYCNARSVKEGLVPAYTIDKTRSDEGNSNGSDALRWTVTWNRAANGYRLPTEAEWELSCRAGTSTPFYTGESIGTDQANYNGNYSYKGGAKGVYRRQTGEAGSFAPNPWGLYDMSGNVWEWCWDWYGSYAEGAQSDPAGAASGFYRVYRGGSWRTQAQNVRSAVRGSYTPSLRRYNLGFRVLRPR
jgi:formylglycine-generating enzyme required for sulfatase activity/TolB-like protein